MLRFTSTLLKMQQEEEGKKRPHEAFFDMFSTDKMVYSRDHNRDTNYNDLMQFFFKYFIIIELDLDTCTKYTSFQPIFLRFQIFKKVFLANSDLKTAVFYFCFFQYFQRRWT